MTLLTASGCFVWGELRNNRMNSRGRVRCFQPLATFQHHRPFGESDVLPVGLPSHAEANDGVKTLRANCGLIKVNWCFHWCE